MNKWLRYLLFVSFATLYFAQSHAMSEAEKEFHRINSVIFGSDEQSIAKKKGVEVSLKEIFSGYGGAFRVDSVFKPIGETHYLVTLTGAAADDPNTLYARIIFACHELGHLIGDAPRVKGMAGEGAADDAAVRICMKEYYQQPNTRIFISDYNAQQMRLCEEHYSNTNDQIICLTSLSTIASLVEYWNKSLKQENQLSLYDSDPTVVNKTKLGYPSKTCRIQTMREAALGLTPPPSCWYHPDN